MKVILKGDLKYNVQRSFALDCLNDYIDKNDYGKKGFGWYKTSVLMTNEHLEAMVYKTKTAYVVRVEDRR